MVMMHVTGEALRQHVIRAWQVALPDSDPVAGFFDQGGSSLRAALLIGLLEEELGLSVPYAVLTLPGGVDEVIAWLTSNAAVSGG
jgi:hypothetical protein